MTQAAWKIVRRVVFVLAGAVVLAATVLAVRIWKTASAFGACAYVPVAQAPSPDGQFVATSARGECNSTVAFFTVVTVVRPGSNQDYQRKRIATIEGEAVRIGWEGGTLVIRYRAKRPPNLGRAPVPVVIRPSDIGWVTRGRQDIDTTSQTSPRSRTSVR